MRPLRPLHKQHIAHLLLLLVAIPVGMLDWRLLLSLQPMLFLIAPNIRQAIRACKIHARSLISALRQPSCQYRLALLLSTLLAVLLAWTTCHAAPAQHALVAFTGYGLLL